MVLFSVKLIFASYVLKTNKNVDLRSIEKKNEFVGTLQLQYIYDVKYRQKLIKKSYTNNINTSNILIQIRVFQCKYKTKHSFFKVSQWNNYKNN